jgi:hypothetical protein
MKEEEEEKEKELLWDDSSSAPGEQIYNKNASNNINDHSELI